MFEILHKDAPVFVIGVFIILFLLVVVFVVTYEKLFARKIVKIDESIDNERKDDV